MSLRGGNGAYDERNEAARLQGCMFNVIMYLLSRVSRHAFCRPRRRGLAKLMSRALAERVLNGQYRCSSSQRARSSTSRQSSKPRRPARRDIGTTGPRPLPPRNTAQHRRSPPNTSAREAPSPLALKRGALAAVLERGDLMDPRPTRPGACCWRCILQKCRRASSQRGPVCKGQVSALPTRSNRSVTSHLPTIVRSPISHAVRAILPSPCLRLPTPRLTTGSSPSLPSPSSLRRLVTAPTMSPTHTPHPWLHEHSQCRKLVCLQSSQSLSELSR